MTEDEVQNMMERTSYIAADEALRLRLCDKVEASVDENTKYLKRITDYADFHKQCNLVLNTIINPKIHNVMFTKVTMRLKLNDAATEDNIVAAIDSIENRAKDSERMALEAVTEAQNKAKADADELDRLKAKLQKAEEAAAKAKAEYEDCKSLLDAMEADKAKAEDEAKETKAKNLIEDFAKIGKIKNEETIKLQWTKLAKADFEGTKNMLDALPLNKTAVPLISEPNSIPAGELPTTAIGLLARNRLKRQGAL